MKFKENSDLNDIWLFLEDDGRNETDIVNDPSLFNSMDMSEPSVEELRAKKYRTVEV